MATRELGLGIIAAPAASAHQIARVIVEKKLAACAQVTQPVASVYWWQGRLEQADEVLIFLKTRKALIPSIQAILKSVHPYEVPELTFLPITGGGEAYLTWLASALDVQS